MIARLVDNQDKLLAGAAISALGKIGGPNAMKALADAKNKASGKLLLVILDAYLKCADRLVAEGEKAQALAIYKELQDQNLPKPIRSAALTSMINAAKQ
jgi:hypothetical protein